VKNEVFFFFDTECAYSRKFLTSKEETELSLGYTQLGKPGPSPNPSNLVMSVSTVLVMTLLPARHKQNLITFSIPIKPVLSEPNSTVNAIFTVI
jgi:hypothetical protein